VLISRIEKLNSVQMIWASSLKQYQVHTTINRPIATTWAAYPEYLNPDRRLRFKKDATNERTNYKNLQPRSPAVGPFLNCREIYNRVVDWKNERESWDHNG
jgi:hypothetical protein